MVECDPSIQKKKKDFDEWGNWGLGCTRLGYQATYLDFYYHLNGVGFYIMGCVLYNIKPPETHLFFLSC